MNATPCGVSGCILCCGSHKAQGGKLKRGDGIVKRCSTCGELKPISEFHRHRRNPDGHAYTCKSCRLRKEEAKARQSRAQYQRHFERNEEVKQCKTCDQVKPIAEFRRDPRCADGYRYSCEACIEQAHYSRYYKRGEQGEQLKRCETCGELKSVNEFPKDSKQMGGYRHSCKTCHKRKAESRAKKTQADYRQYYEQDKHLKRCSTCGELKPVSEFYRHHEKPDGYEYSCKVCRKVTAKARSEEIQAYHRRWYEENRQDVLNYSKRKYDQRRQWLDEYKREKGCEFCGEDDSNCLILHHTGGEKKEANIAMVFAKWPWSRVLEEMESCSVLCANCHRKLHFREKTGNRRERKGRRIAVREWFREYKESLSCELCGENSSECISFHHRSQDDKTDDVATLVAGNRKREYIIAERGKCDIFCANCHRKLHASTRN